MAFHIKKRLAKPLVIFLAAIGLGMFVLGLTLTIIGTLPGYAPYGGNPLKIVGPILLVLGVLILAGVIVEWCVRSQRDRQDMMEKSMVDYSQPKATFHTSSYPRKPKKQEKIKEYEPPLQTSTPGNVTLNPSPATFRPEDILPHSQALLTRSDSKEGVPLPNRPSNGAFGVGNQGSNQPRVNPGQKSAHFEPIHRAPPTQNATQYAQIVHTQRQHSASSANYFYPTVTNPQQQGKPQQGQYQPNGYNSAGSGDGNLNKTTQRWGNSRECLDDQQDTDSRNELPVLDINNAGKDNTKKSKGKSDKGKGGPGDKYGRTGSYREAHKDREKPTKSPRAQRRAGGQNQMDGDNEKRYSAENEAYVHEMGVDVEMPSQSTHKERDAPGAYNSERSMGQEAQGNSNFSRKNSSRTRRGSKRRPRGERRAAEQDWDMERERERERPHDHGRERDRSRERPHRERSSSRGRLGLDDSTTLDYVRGVPIDKDSRRRAPSNKPSSSGAGTGDNDSERHRRHHEHDQRRHHDSYESPHSTSPSDTSHPSDHRSKHKHSGGHHNGAFVDDRALTPKMSPEEFLNSKHVKDAKNMNFTININAQPGSAVQIALGNKDLPTPKPMITATPMKSEVHTHMPGMQDA